VPYRVISSSLAAWGLCLLTTGCTHPATWHYGLDTYAPRPQPVLPKTVAVPPFLDARSDRNLDATSMGHIPLMPYGWYDHAKPESRSVSLLELSAWRFRPSRDLAKAAADELNASGLFDEVFFTERPSDGDLILRGTVKSTRYWGRVMTYGLSRLGKALWLILPKETFHNELVIDLSLQERGADAPLWQKSYTYTYHKSPVWIYYRPADFAYDRMFKEAMQDCVKSLESALSGR